MSGVSLVEPEEVFGRALEIFELVAGAELLLRNITIKWKTN